MKTWWKFYWCCRYSQSSKVEDLFCDAPSSSTRPRGYKTFFMLNSAEHEFFLVINVKMPTMVGILTFMSRKNSVIGLFEPEKR